ncbi:hypothetical protein [Bacillus atrophaeus]|uniref:hypothetical protein n=1 Tax=Bacillus atrophaeus TaxID=1452 RepID=UPI00228142A8|nr:hypothetical protein [Bacillus atrophaeus]MCY9165905.1 hypothetical protein [Bacillus atrophaeus]
MISGWASIVYGITGLNSTVISGNLSGIDAFKMAASYIKNDVIDKDYYVFPYQPYSRSVKKSVYDRLD